MPIIDTILQKMSTVLKPKRTFQIVVLTMLMYLPGKAQDFRSGRLVSGNLRVSQLLTQIIAP